MDPFVFWTASGGKYPNLAKVAFDILTIPVSSASVERMFSKSGLSCLGRKNRLSFENLENKVIVRMNRDLLQL